MQPVLNAFDQGAQNVAEVIPALIEEFGTSPYEAEEPIPSGWVTVLNNRAHLARNYMSTASLLTSPRRNHHEITDLR